jgi:hypothetical protein
MLGECIERLLSQPRHASRCAPGLTPPAPGEGRRQHRGATAPRDSSSTVIRHSVRGSPGSVSVAEWQQGGVVPDDDVADAVAKAQLVARRGRVRGELVEQVARLVVGHADDAERAARDGVERLPSR